MIKALRTYYFFLFCVNGALFPVLPLLLSHRGLSPSEIGWVMVVNPVLGAILPPLWGAFADRYRKRERLISFVTLASAAAVLLLAIPSTVEGSMLAMAVFCVFRAPIMSLVDATTYSALGENRAAFGGVRVFGSLGFTLAALAVGFVGVSTRPDMLFIACSGLFALCGLTSRWFVDAPVSREPVRPGLRDVVAYALDPRLIPLFFTNVLYYGAHAIFDVFFMLHVKSLGRDEGFASLGFSIGVFVEVLIMLLARRLFARFDPGKVLIVCSFVSTVRWLGTAELDSGWALLALQGLHGITFGLWYLALVAHVHERVPEEARTSVQGVLLGSLAAGTASGCLAGGRILETYGSASAFRAAALVTLVTLFLYAIRQQRLARAAVAPDDQLLAPAK